MMIVGYARVSTSEQDVARQLDLFETMGVDRVVEEKVSGDKYRPELERLLGELEDGDRIVVDDLDRLSRNLREQLNILDDLSGRGVQFFIGDRQFDYRNATIGEFYELVMRGAAAEGQLRSIRANTRKGIAAYKKRNGRWGRKPKLDRQKRDHVRELIGQGKSQGDVGSLFDVSARTVRRVLDMEEE